MAKIKTKCVIIGRMKRKDNTKEDYPCFISFFGINDPHKTGEVPDKINDYEDIHKIIIEGLDVNYLLAGNDIVINDLEYVEIKVDKQHVIVTGKQSRQN
jgi:hypothetical protein